VKIALPANDLSDRRLGAYVAMGVEALTVPHRLNTEYVARSPKPMVPPVGRGPSDGQAAPPQASELRRVCARAREFGLEPIATGVGLSRDIIMCGSGRDADIATFAEAVRVIGDVGIGVITLNFTALRASEGYDSHHDGRGGAQQRNFDASRVQDLPPLRDVGSHSASDMWQRLAWFLEQTVPVAAAAGVRFAMHPNDPPVEQFRGVAQPLCDFGAMQRLVESVDDAANCVYFDSGVATEWGENSADVARWFASRDRIGIAHIRNVRVHEPRLHYTETFIDDGDADIAAVLQVLRDCGYDGGIDPDHTPGFTMDGEEMWIGWATSVGTLRGLR
jgi:mannonate dehydratase